MAPSRLLGQVTTPRIATAMKEPVTPILKRKDFGNDSFLSGVLPSGRDNSDGKSMRRESSPSPVKTT